MRIAILSDIHGNLAALESVWEHLAGQRVDEILCLGDSIGYGPRPDEVCKQLMARSVPSVLGNHEWALVKKSRRHWFNPQAKEALTITEGLLTPEVLTWIKTLPLFLVAHDCRFVHGAPPDSVRTYLFELSNDELLDMFREMKERHAFVGHTHDLELVECDGAGVDRGPLREGVSDLRPDHRYLVNVGSVGQPRDGDNRAKYVIWDQGAQHVELHRVAYDIAATATEILRLGFPEQYARRLW